MWSRPSNSKCKEAKITIASSIRPAASMVLPCCSSPLMELPVPLQELILASLPLRTVLAVSSACKHFHSLVSSLPLARLHSLSPINRSPWFFLFAFNFFLPHRNQAFALCPLTDSWIRLPFKPPLLHINFSSLAAMNGALFAFTGAKQSRLCIALSPLKQNWHVIEAPMAVSRKNPLVGMFFQDAARAPDLGNCNNIAVAGGVDDDCDEDDKLAVEVFRVSKGYWERCESMPEGLRGKSLCSAVVGGMFYVVDWEGAMVCRLDMKFNAVWMEGKVERPKGVKRWQVVGSDDGLWAVAVGGGRVMKVYKMMVEAGMEGGKLEVGLQELVTMPAEMYNELFDEEEDDAVEELRCCGGGQNRLYIYRDTRFKENVTCVCDMSNMSWFKVPPLLVPLHHFNKVACLSSVVSLSSLI